MANKMDMTLVYFLKKNTILGMKIATELQIQL